MTFTSKQMACNENKMAVQPLSRSAFGLEREFVTLYKKLFGNLWHLSTAFSTHKGKQEQPQISFQYCNQAYKESELS